MQQKPAEPTLGLTSAQVQALAAQGQTNRLPRPADGGVPAIIRRNVFTLFNLLNLVLAGLLLWVGSYRNLLFMGVVVSNTIIGLVQELRAKRMHDKLLLLSEGKVQTLRDGELTPIAPAALVLGDVVRLRRGDQAPADAQVLAGSAELNEALLTGEGEPVPKAAGDALLSGSYVTEGEVTARLTAVGENSFAGKLQQSARKVKRPKSTLMASLTYIIRIVSVVLVPISCLLFWKQSAVLQLPLPLAMTKTVGAAIGMIPEGLMLLTSMALAVGVIRLGQRNALVNELYGIENLARVDTLCLDKTGTLTSGRMRLAGIHPLADTTQAAMTIPLRALAQAFLGEDTPTWQALTAVYPPSDAYTPTATVPFSSERKWSAASFDGLGTLVMGAPERVAATQADMLALASTYAQQGLRVLALMHTASPTQGKTLPHGLQPLGLITLSDTLRPDAADTLAYFTQQDVALKILSGDSPLTVSRIAREAGLAGAEHWVDCAALPATPDYAALAQAYTVFGRVSPEDKRALVKALKAQGRTVAMIGDGVNDVPALKAADCSIAMAGGSDAAARVAQITLLDADFAVMPQILLEGRRVINNITRASALFLVKNLFSFLLSAFLLILPFAYPFAPIQLTLVSTLSIGFPSFVLALQPNRERVRGSFLGNVLLRSLPGGVTVAIICLLLQYAGRANDLSAEVVSTLCTLVAAFSGLCVLTLTCLPLDKLRGGLVAFVATAMVLAVLLFPQIFYLVPLTGVASTLLPLALAGTLALLLLFSWLLTRLMPGASRKDAAS